MQSIFEGSEGVIELALQFEDVGVGDELDFLQLFREVEDVHRTDVVLDVLRYFAVDAYAANGVVESALFAHGGFVDVLLADDFAAQHSFNIRHSYLLQMMSRISYC